MKDSIRKCFDMVIFLEIVLEVEICWRRLNRVREPRDLQRNHSTTPLNSTTKGYAFLFMRKHPRIKHDEMSGVIAPLCAAFMCLPCLSLPYFIFLSAIKTARQNATLSNVAC